MKKNKITLNWISAVAFELMINTKNRLKIQKIRRKLINQEKKRRENENGKSNSKYIFKNNYQF